MKPTVSLSTGTRSALTLLLAAASLVSACIPAAAAVLYDPFWWISVATTVVLALSGLTLTRVPEQRFAGHLLLGAASTVNLVQLNWWNQANGLLGEIAFISTWYPMPFLAVAYLIYPDGGPGRLAVRAFAIGAVAWAVVPRLALALTHIGPAAPASRWWIGLVDLPAIADALVWVEVVGSAGLAAWAIVLFVVRWRRARGTASVLTRIMSGAGIILAVGLVAREVGWILFRADRIARSTWDRIGDVHQLVILASIATVGVTVYRSFARRGALTERLLATAGDPVGLQDVLRDELRDPSVAVYFRVDDGWVSADGTPRPASEPDRDVVELATAEGRPVVLASLDPLDRLDPVRRRVALAASGVVLNAASVTLERDAYVAELAASRARIAVGAEGQRRDLERMLHDGIQQSLLAATATLSRAKLEGTRGDATQVGATIDQARRQLLDALAELRRLARGLYPASLAESGLLGGAQSLAERWPGVVLHVDAPELGYSNMAPESASAVYFALAEGLANAHKYGTPPVTIHLRQDDDTVTGEISDAGPGGAAFVAGGGLGGLRDRVSGLGGGIELFSPDGGPTRLVVTVPRRR